jgi:hypothetical protein
LALGFQVGVVCDLSGFLFDVAFQFMKLAFDLILRARFHLVPPLLFRELFTKAVSGIHPFVDRDRPFGATSIRIGVSRQVNLPSSATGANENIPTPHHRAETTPEE